MSATIWTGPSLIDGQPIRLVITGYDRPSGNRKTGPMVQSWILPDNGGTPTEGQSSVCGDCPVLGVCYVDKSKAVAQAARSNSNDTLADWHIPRPLRIGSWGDPSAVPSMAWDRLLSHKACTGHTGYTHRQTGDDSLIGIAMASVETRGQARHLQREGWRTFRIGTDGPMKSETLCPHYSHGVQCTACGLCDGFKTNIYTPVRFTANRAAHWPPKGKGRKPKVDLTDVFLEPAYDELADSDLASLAETAIQLG